MGLINIVIYSSEGTKRVQLPAGDISVGRSDKADLKIDSTHLSRKHLSIKVHDQNLFVCDLGTTNGSFLNGRKMNANQWYPITPIDEVKLGVSEIRLEISYQSEEDKAEILNFKPKEDDSDKTKVHHVASKMSPVQPSTSSAAVKIQSDHDLYQQEQYLDQQISDIQSQISDVEAPKLSEVQMLQIKKLEIDSKVAAIKIKEDAEILAKKLIDEAKNKASNIEATSLAEIKEKTQEIKKLKEKINQLNDTLYNLGEQKNQLDQDVNELNVSKNVLTDDISQYEEDLSELKQKYSDLKERLTQEEEDFKNRFELEREKNNMIIQNMIKDAKILEDEKKSIQAEIDEELETKNKLEEKIHLLKEREESAQDKYHETQKRVDKIYNEKESLEEKCQLIKEDIALHEEKRNELKSEIESYQKQIEEEVDQYQTKINEKQKELDDLIQKLETEFENGKQQLEDDLAAVFKEHEKEKAALIDEKERLALEIIENANSKANLIIQDAQALKENLEQKEQELFEKQEKVHEEIYQLKSQAQAEVDNLLELTQKEVHELRENTKTEVNELKDKTEKNCQNKLTNLERHVQDVESKTLKEYEEALTRAKEKAEVIINEAKEKSESIISEAKNEAKHFFNQGKQELEKAQAKSNELIQSAQDKALQTHKDGLKELEQRKDYLDSTIKEKELAIKDHQEQIDQLNIRLDELKKNLDLEREKLKQEIQDEKNTIISEAKKHADDIVKEASNKLSEALTQIGKDKAEAIRQAEIEIKQKNKAEEIKFQTMMREEKEMLTKLRAQEMENIKQLREKEEQDLKQRKIASIDQMARGIETLVNLKLKKFSEANLKGANVSLEAETIRKLVSESLKDKKSQDTQFLKLVNPYGSFGVGKSQKEMKRLAIAGGIIVVLTLIHFIFPSFYPSIKDQIAGVVKVENSAKDLYLEKLEEKRKNKPKFSPTLSDSFKGTLTDNIIYTTNFADIWLSDDFQRDWAVKVDEIIVYQLQLSDQRVIQFISEEFKSIRKLQEMRDKIKIETQEEQIQQMRLAEEQMISNLKNIVGGDQNLKKIQESQKKFFENYKK